MTGTEQEVTPASRAPLAWSQSISSMGFNPLPPTAWEKKRTGSREVAETTPLSPSPVEASSRGNPDTSEGLRIYGRPPFHRGSACHYQKALSQICWLLVSGACLCWDSDPGMGPGCLDCGVGARAGRTDLETEHPTDQKWLR